MTSFESLKPDLTCERILTVSEQHTVSHTGTPILSTPWMIGLMESTSSQLVHPLLPSGFTTVGFEVHVRHKAPAHLGAEIKVFARLLEVKSRHLLFEVRVTEGERVIGEGTHRRTIIPLSH